MEKGIKLDSTDGKKKTTEELSQDQFADNTVAHCISWRTHIGLLSVPIRFSFLSSCDILSRKACWIFAYREQISFQYVRENERIME